MSSLPVQLGLVGWPLGHSLSPVLHEAALAAHQRKGAYRLYPLHPDEAENGLRSLFTQMRAGEIRGLNVTIPYKQTVIPMLDQLTPTAQAIGAVNTIYLSDGQLIGDNTDAEGFYQDLEPVLPPFTPPGTALVLGAGGAARAVVYSLLEHGWQVFVAARRLMQAEGLAEEFSELGKISAGLLPEMASMDLTDVKLIVNATPVGMSPNVTGSPWPSTLSLPAGAVVYDLVYNPRVTALMRQAEDAGLKAVSGLGMLVGQAALAFSRWLDISPPVAVMTAAIGKHGSQQGARQ